MPPQGELVGKRAGMNEVTRIINAIQQGDGQAADELLPLVYNELRHLAHQKLSHESPGQTLQATALVHEAYIRLVGAQSQNWDGRGHFFAAAAEAMRRILVENVMRKRTYKRGGDQKRVDYLSGGFLQRKSRSVNTGAGDLSRAPGASSYTASGHAIF